MFAPYSLVIDEDLSNLNRSSLRIPLFSTRIMAGFPSPADDYLETTVDLNLRLIKHPASTFFLRVSGDSMIRAGIQEGNILVVDRSIQAKSGDIVIATVDGEFTVKRLHIVGSQVSLVPENPKYAPLALTEEMDFSIWGVVTSVINELVN